VSRPSSDTVSIPIEVSEETPTGPTLDHWASIEEFSRTPAGTTIGRYVVLGTLGTGGMGTVLRAYDPKLRREVALKKLRPTIADAESEARLVREARILAQLNHPNVVSVYDVDVHAGSVIVAMELIGGTTLHEWMKGSHPWQERLEVLLVAGRGLAAAHRADLVHRDFKPANVMIDPAGQAKVMDFGLAKSAADQRPEPSSAQDFDDPAAVEFIDLTGTLETAADMLVGTPAYMAPEQHDGERAGPAADQYAFCLTLWEALVGTRPFHGTLRELSWAKHRGPPAWPRDLAVPAELTEAIRRGLSVSPADRWPDMEALLETLTYVPPRRGRAWRLAALGVGALATTMLAWAWWAQRAERCTGAREQLEDAWGERARTLAQASVLDVQVPYAQKAWADAEAHLDDYAARWARLHTEACEATTVRGEQSIAALDRQMQCLHRARHDLEVVTRLLSRADATVVEHIPSLLDALPPLSPCEDLEALLEGTLAPPPEDAMKVERMRALLMSARSERAAGRYPLARATMAELTDRLPSLDYVPLQIEVDLEQSRLLDAVGEYEAAAEALHRVLDAAAAIEDWDALQRAATSLVFVLGYQLKRPDEAMPYRELAQRLTRGDPATEGSLASNLAGVLSVQGRHEEAEAEYLEALEHYAATTETDPLTLAQVRLGLANVLSMRGLHARAEQEYQRVLELRIRRLGPDHPQVAVTLSNLAITLEKQGRYTEAEAELGRALEIAEGAYEPDHPQVGKIYMNLSNVLQGQGRYDAAEDAARQALTRLGRAMGPDHADVALTRCILANSLLGQTRYEEAEVELRRGLDTLRATLGPHHPLVAMVAGNLGVLLEQQHRYEDAEHLLRETLAQQREAVGAEHPDVARTQGNLGTVLLAQGKHAEAETELREALALKLATMGSDHPSVAHSRTALADLRLKQGRIDEALSLAELAWDRHRRDDVSPSSRAHTAFVLARARWAHGAGDRSEREQARALALRARDEHEGAAEDPYELAEVRAWLRAHPPVER